MIEKTMKKKNFVVTMVIESNCGEIDASFHRIFCEKKTMKDKYNGSPVKQLHLVNRIISLSNELKPRGVDIGAMNYGERMQYLASISNFLSHEGLTTVMPESYDKLDELGIRCHQRRSKKAADLTQELSTVSIIRDEHVQFFSQNSFYQYDINFSDKTISIYNLIEPFTGSPEPRPYNVERLDYKYDSGEVIVPFIDLEECVEMLSRASKKGGFLSYTKNGRETIYVLKKPN